MYSYTSRYHALFTGEGLRAYVKLDSALQKIEDVDHFLFEIPVKKLLLSVDFDFVTFLPFN